MAEQATGKPTSVTITIEGYSNETTYDQYRTVEGCQWEGPKQG